MERTEFFETAVQQGFYGLDQGGLSGKKDNVRKYWEDISIKTAIRRPILNLLGKKNRLKIVDLGSGSGEGYELLTHIPPANKTTTHRDFVLDDALIEKYLGVDISPSMVEQGQNNYRGKNNIEFFEENLAESHSFLGKGPFDVYFSSYSSPSHLRKDELGKLLEAIFAGNTDEFVVALDLFGKYSPEWPNYWKSSDIELQPYNMKWLYPSVPGGTATVEDYYVRFWGATELRELIAEVAVKENRQVSVNCLDRSILVGRHMETGHYSNHPLLLRTEVNRFFDRDYRGVIGNLRTDISHLETVRSTNPNAYDRIHSYANIWNSTIDFLEALIKGKYIVAAAIKEAAPADLKEELQMLSWLEANASRFPVVDFWASVMGPQVACILRNMELDLPQGLGCGHGLFCTIEVSKK